jgi:hypothetical protein
MPNFDEATYMAITSAAAELERIDLDLPDDIKNSGENTLRLPPESESRKLTRLTLWQGLLWTTNYHAILVRIHAIAIHMRTSTTANFSQTLAKQYRTQTLLHCLSTPCRARLFLI